jgi:hydrogenase nickel incorporation protein HypB
MCATCGCSGDGASRIGEHDDHDDRHGHDHAHGHHEQAHDDSHQHRHGHHVHSHHDGASGVVHASREARTIRLEEDLLAKNDRLAERNRGWLAARRVSAWNLMSSPGAGKTTLLEQTILRLRDELPISVIEGDQETARDAERIRATGVRAVQVNTGSGCHLDADMLAVALEKIDPPAGSLLFIENVGNLVCPALFDLGERGKIVMLSVTEGDDKPLKYPHMFRASDVLVLTKTDLLPYVPFDVDRFLANARQVNPRLRVFRLSSTSGEGLDAWCAWLRAEAGAQPGMEASR